MKKVHQSNAEKQRAYRDRKRNARKEPSRRSRALPKSVTVKQPAIDPHRQFLGEWFGVKHYAWVVCHRPDCRALPCLQAMEHYRQQEQKAALAGC